MTLSVVGLSKRLGGRAVLREVALSGEGGTCFALLGDNGAGKSTLLRILGGILEADAGRATLGGASILGPHAPARARVGYVPEAADPPPHLTPREVCALVAALKGTAPPGPETIERLALGAFWDRPTGSLSLGQRRRACLAAALVGDVGLLLLDEPTNGLDQGGVAELSALVRERCGAGVTALVATHDLAFAEAIGATRLRLVEGRVIA
jgi:ABC-type multidrug transport system ATPase subunit